MTNRERIEKELHKMSVENFYRHLEKGASNTFLCFFYDCEDCEKCKARAKPCDCIDLNIDWLSKKSTPKHKANVERWCK